MKQLLVTLFLLISSLTYAQVAWYGANTVCYGEGCELRETEYNDFIFYEDSIFQTKQDGKEIGFAVHNYEIDSTTIEGYKTHVFSIIDRKAREIKLFFVYEDLYDGDFEGVKKVIWKTGQAFEPTYYFYDY